MEDITKDLLKKIDDLSKIISDQNLFIMKMLTYHDEREDKLADIRSNRLLQFLHAADSSEILKNLLDLTFPNQFKNPNIKEDESTH